MALREPTDAAEIVRLIASGHITPPAVGYAPCWLWHTRPDHAADEVEPLYAVAPAHAEGIARIVGAPGVLDMLYPPSVSVGEQLTDWLAEEQLAPRL